MYSPFAKLHMNYTDGGVTAFPSELAHISITQLYTHETIREL